MIEVDTLIFRTFIRPIIHEDNDEKMLYLLDGLCDILEEDRNTSTNTLLRVFEK